MAADDGKTEKRGWRLPDQLPPLSGWARTVFLALWGAVFAFAAGVFAVGLPSAFEAAPISPVALVGFNLDPDDASIIALTVGEEAARAGIRKGDRLLRVDGQPVALDHAAIARQFAGPLGERIAVDVQTRDGRVSRHWLTRDPVHIGQGHADAGLTRELYFAVNNGFRWLASLLLLVCAVILVARRLRDPLAPWASLMMIVVAIGTGGIDVWLTNAGGAWASIAFWANVSPFLPMVLAVLPNGSLRPRLTWAVLVAAPILTCLAVVLPDLVGTIALGLLLIAGVLLVLRRYRSMEASERQQIRWVLFGLALAMLMFAVGTACRWIDGQADSYSTVIWLRMVAISAYMASLILFIGAITIALLRYRLYDADTVISRSAGYAVLTLLLAGVFGASAKAIEWFFEASYGREAGALPGAIGAGLAVVLITPMHNRIHRWAEQRFQKALLHLRCDLPDCVSDLRETAGLKELLDEVLARVEAGTRAIRSAIVIDGKTVAARGEGADYPVSVPLAVGHQDVEIGTLLVGPRPDGSRPGKDEREALHEIADPVARAIRIAGAREAEKRHIERRFAALEVAFSKRASRPAPTSS